MLLGIVTWAPVWDRLPTTPRAVLKVSTGNSSEFNRQLVPQPSHQVRGQGVAVVAVHAKLLGVSEIKGQLSVEDVSARIVGTFPSGALVGPPHRMRVLMTDPARFTFQLAPGGHEYVELMDVLVRADQTTIEGVPWPQFHGDAIDIAVEVVAGHRRLDRRVFRIDGLTNQNPYPAISEVCGNHAFRNVMAGLSATAP